MNHEAVALTTVRDVCIDVAGPLPDSGRIARGTAFVDSQRLTSEQLLEAMPDDRRDARSFLMRLNGFFALAGRRGDDFVAAVDRVRSWPVF